MKTKDQLYQRESVIVRPSVVLNTNPQCGPHVVHKIYLYKKQDHFGKTHNTCLIELSMKTKIMCVPGEIKGA